MSSNALSIQNISKSYAGRDVVNDVSFFVQGGEVVGLLGPNGAGKTTCFYIACGLVRANSGKVSLNKKRIDHLPMHKRADLGLGYLPQEPSIFRKLSVENNIMAVLELNSSLNKKQRVHRLEELLAEFSIEHIRHIKGISLSGGERRRVEIARALAMDPKFVLLDEPFAGVDPISVGDIQKIIYHLKGKDIGILITDHNYREMLDTCDHSYVLHNGAIIAQGNKEQILYNEKVREVYLGEYD
ncbi:lipopolysaccharide export system ATP-binding protein [Abyssogena phaseoliformis symbiont OG214]|uniref:LPS export ABC transporter ATP-binding protein n=1 Tax=Abyssogena phaseoliformis symbiont TaxID=596095 RepID=UPI001914FB0C|nr:LPS export ABC transporter ATP-binding protein [Abyssogena phaseoliformis symbiont]MBW5289842.1 Lipopolysaccharide ABC transporter, ATP-binding protein LptB [Candidatus Ruthia sp. Apha_13_S6]BBB23108.1 lipopolysaccharide export system ATP-binding protein [Abyssogena phaseoliformis symbiont OG214]